MENEILLPQVVNDLIVVDQMPVITDNLRSLKPLIEEETQKILSLPCTEETIATIKKFRAKLNKDAQELDKQRKFIKKTIMAPYDAMEAVYKDCVGDLYAKADAQLRDKINAVQGSILAEKAANVAAYFDEYILTCKHIKPGFVSFDQAGVHVTMSVSEKRLKEECKAFLDRVDEEVASVHGMDRPIEILVEYRKTLNLAQAISIVQSRTKEYEAYERLREVQEAEEEEPDEIVEEEANAVPAAEEAPTAAPMADPEEVIEEPVFKATFTVTATLSKLKELKNFLNNGGYEYV